MESTEMKLFSHSFTTLRLQDSRAETSFHCHLKSASRILNFSSIGTGSLKATQIFQFVPSQLESLGLNVYGHLEDSGHQFWVEHA